METGNDLIILDLGCGNRKRPGAIGVDRMALGDVNIIHDLEMFPYPFPDNFADSVIMSHILEHVEYPMQVLEEVWRISKPGAKIEIRVPHYSGMFAWRDPTHRRAFSTPLLIILVKMIFPIILKHGSES